MTHWIDLFQKHDTYNWLDHTQADTLYNKPNTALTSFALDDALAEAVGKGSTPASIRFWCHQDTVVLGIADGRLPDLKTGIDWLNYRGHAAVIRSSGGLAVPLDAGVLNMSLIFPDSHHLSITEGYDAMVQLIRDMFSDLTDAIEAHEITGSYCPGDYDLSIDGKKFAGISQRRVRDAVAIQIYLDVLGNSEKRAELIRGFYQQAINDVKTQFTYPDVTPGVMGSLNHLLASDLTIDTVKKRAFNVFNNAGLGSRQNAASVIDPEVLEKRYTQMQKRNADIAMMQAD